MRNAADNPFSPGSDHLPPVWAGRFPQLNDWEAVVRPRRSAGIYERGRTFLGEAGLGKSTLVQRIAKMASEQGDVVTAQIRLPAGADPLKAVARELLKLADRIGISASYQDDAWRCRENIRTQPR